jgi:lipid-A-disaccharide synthase-like uncharacterized protein
MTDQKHPANETLDRIEQFPDTQSNAARVVFVVALFMFTAFLVASLPFEISWKAGQSFFEQPGHWTIISIIGMTVFCLPLLIQTIRFRDRNQSSIAEIKNWILALEYVGWFLSYSIVMGYIGYLPASILFCTLLAWRTGYQDRKSLLSAIFVAIFTVVVFKSFLTVKIPGGAIYEYLPEGLRNIMIHYF